MKLAQTLPFAAAAAAVALSLAAPAARAGDTIAVGKAVPFAWTFTPLDIGSEVGIFKKHGFDTVKIVGFGGDAKLQQGLLAKNIAFGLASGPGMAFNAKGGAGIGVAAYYGAPYNLMIAVPYGSTLTLDQLKGKKLGVTTVGSLTAWLARRLSQHQGWGPEGITPVALGGLEPELAGLKTHQVDGLVIATEVTYLMQSRKQLQPLYNFAKLVPDFITHVVYARKDLVKSNPDQVRRFVAAWLETLEFIRTHKDKAVEISARVLHQPVDNMARVYDEEVQGFSKTGAFDAKAVALLKETFVEMGLLKSKPDDSQLFTTEFLPKM